MIRRRTFLAGSAIATLGVAACAGRQATPLPDAIAERDFPPLGEVVQVDGLNVHALSLGEGGPPVVLLHGASVNLRDWSFNLMQPFAEKRRVIAMDRPGFGYSQRGPGDWSPQRQARQLRAATKKLGIEKPIVVGHSWGASVALAWALDAPDDVSGVVSVSGVTMPWGLGVSIAGALGLRRLGVDYYMASLSRRAEEGGIEDFVARAFRPQVPPPGYLDFVGAPLSLRAETMEANSQDLAELQSSLVGMAKAYPSIKVPVEIVHGELDWLLSVERHVDGFKALVSQTNVAVAPGIGHMAHHARPDLVDAAIDRIAASVV